MALKKILIADDHLISRRGLNTLLKHQWPEATIIEASNGLEASTFHLEFQPDLTILDYRMPQQTGLEAAKQIVSLDKNANLILLTMFDSIAIALNFLKIGGKGFLNKDGNIDHIINAVTSVSSGNYYFSTTHEREIISWMKTGMKKNVPYISFSEREIQLCIFISKGMTNTEIASAMGLSPRTIETYRSNLIQKTKVGNSLELVAFVYENGIA